ncbi:helix-turn-helix domain-containing protein [Halorussus halobius]|uniref:helix-turn-helix domain-containing protein n=1 Tax=Halorussus halobius TaxID=1710537 RepID=UPI001092C55E|nr:helix-turn-helix domain-containing protein [Halorussus halobius]
MKRVSISLDRSRADAHPLHRAVIDDDAVSEATVLAWDAGRPTPTTLSRLDCPRSAAEPLVEDLAAVESYALSADGERTYAFVRQRRFEMDARLADALAVPGVLVRPPVTFGADGSVRFTFVGTRDALGSLLERLDATGGYSLVGVDDYGGPAGSSRLTDRQREAVSVAVDVGYYDVPRTATMAEVASGLGCSESTASELVRKGQAAIVRAQVDRT